MGLCPPPPTPAKGKLQSGTDLKMHVLKAGQEFVFGVR